MKWTFIWVLALGLWVLPGCMVEEEPNNANFKWSTNNGMPVSPKQTSFGAPTINYSSPTSETKFRSKGFGDVMGHEN